MVLDTSFIFNEVKWRLNRGRCLNYVVSEDGPLFLLCSTYHDFGSSCLEFSINLFCFQCLLACRRKISTTTIIHHSGAELQLYSMLILELFLLSKPKKIRTFGHIKAVYQTLASPLKLIDIHLWVSSFLQNPQFGKHELIGYIFLFHLFWNHRFHQLIFNVALSNWTTRFFLQTFENIICPIYLQETVC